MFPVDTRQCLETLPVVTRGGSLQASSEQRCGLLLNALQCAGQAPDEGFSGTNANSAQAEDPDVELYKPP